MSNTIKWLFWNVNNRIVSTNCFPYFHTYLHTTCTIFQVYLCKQIHVHINYHVRGWLVKMEADCHWWNIALTPTPHSLVTPVTRSLWQPFGGENWGKWSPNGKLIWSCFSYIIQACIQVSYITSIFTKNVQDSNISWINKKYCN